MPSNGKSKSPSPGKKSPGGAGSISPQQQEGSTPLLGGPARSDAPSSWGETPTDQSLFGRRKFFHNGPVSSPDGEKSSNTPGQPAPSGRGGRTCSCDKAGYARFISWVQDVMDGDEGFEKPCISTRMVCALCCLGVGAIIYLVYATGSDAVGAQAAAFSGTVASMIGLAWSSFVALFGDAGSTVESIGGWVVGAGAALIAAPQALLGLVSGGSGSAVDASALMVWMTESDAEVCPDGLVILGPAPSRFETLKYLLLLVYSFVGVAIGADLFMDAIEYITSQEVDTVVQLPGGKSKTLTAKVWNATVANLSLMALGSSAPEILLSVIEICGTGFHAGELGPSTIVGSAAFNLMIISAVCVGALPAGEGRYVCQTTVFGITSFASVFAYVWLLLILMVWTPNFVTPAEGLATLFFFPILVVIAYKADVGDLVPQWLASCCCSAASSAKSGASHILGTQGAQRQVIVSGSVGVEAYVAHSKAYYRMNAVRDATGGQSVDERAKRRERAPLWAATATSKARANLTVDVVNCEFEIGSSETTVQFTDKYAEVEVFRSGATTDLAYVHYSVTLGRSAGEAGAKAVAAEGRVTFEPTQQKAVLKIAILEQDVTLARQASAAFQEGITAGKKPKPLAPMFHVKIEKPSRGTQVVGCTHAAVYVVGDESPGVLSLPVERIIVKEDAGKATVTLKREYGSKGTISCRVTTKDGRAVAPADYLALDTVVTFKPGQTEAKVDVTIVEDNHFEGDEDFTLIFSEATGGAKFHPDCNGGPVRAIAQVVVECDDHSDACSYVLVRCCGFNFDAFQMVMSAWYLQFEEAITYDDEDGSLVGYAMALPWKLAFAFAPPPACLGGWACFFVALTFIGALTAVIGDLAGHLGCCIGIDKPITAITFVAIGTSLPDTFASMKAAKEEQYADASLGNITGSNSVNVFLGLGLPWAIAALYWTYFATDEAAWRARYSSEDWFEKGTPIGFAVPAGDLSFTVLVFSCCACATLGILFLRRAVFGVELGGPAPWAGITSVTFGLLWCVYIGACIWRSSQ